MRTPILVIAYARPETTIHVIDALRKIKAQSIYIFQGIPDAKKSSKDFKNYYQGEIKMGDTPSLLYMMDGNPDNPTKASWGGQFTPISQSPRVVFDRSTTLADTVAFCTLIEFHFKRGF
jgi:hypothetical protein